MRIESVVGRIIGIFLEQMHVLIELRNPAWSMTSRSSHERDQEAAFGERVELVRNG